MGVRHAYDGRAFIHEGRERPLCKRRVGAGSRLTWIAASVSCSCCKAALKKPGRRASLQDARQLGLFEPSWAPQEHRDPTGDHDEEDGGPVVRDMGQHRYDRDLARRRRLAKCGRTKAEAS